MIKDIFIIKDGIPVLSEHKQDQENTFSNNDDLVMMSGFLSALDSFSHQFKNLGSISQLKLSNDLKLSFMRDSNIENLIYIASSDTKTNDYTVQKALNKVSNTFSNSCNAQTFENWRGKSSYFDQVKQELSKIVNEEEDHRSSSLPKSNQFSNIRPISKVDSKVNLGNFLTGKKAINIFKEVNGYQSITDIAQKLNYDEKEVFNICKNFIKMSLIAFTR